MIYWKNILYPYVLNKLEPATIFFLQNLPLKKTLTPVNSPIEQPFQNL